MEGKVVGIDRRQEYGSDTLHAADVIPKLSKQPVVRVAKWLTAQRGLAFYRMEREEVEALLRKHDGKIMECGPVARADGFAFAVDVDEGTVFIPSAETEKA